MFQAHVGLKKAIKKKKKKAQTLFRSWQLKGKLQASHLFS